MHELMIRYTPNLLDYSDEFIRSIIETLQMLFLSGVYSFILGLFLGTLLVVTRKGNILENKFIYGIINWSVNLFRSIPFVILITALIPVTKFVVGTFIGVKGAIFPLIVGCTPFFIRQVDMALSDIDPGLIEAAKENIEIELVFFDSYPLPNAALALGEIEMNAFQHYIYLEKEIEQHGYDLTPIGETVLAPLGIYSKQIESLDELEDGSTIVIPDDVTNGGRALLLLQDQGMISIDPAAGRTPTLKDIVENPRNFNILELSATNIPASLEEVPIALINSGVARDAGFIPSEDAIVLEGSSEGENPYVNIIVVRTEDKDNEVYNRIVELYQTDETKKVIEEDSKGSSIPVW